MEHIAGKSVIFSRSPMDRLATVQKAPHPVTLTSGNIEKDMTLLRTCCILFVVEQNK